VTAGITYPNPVRSNIETTLTLAGMLKSLRTGWPKH